MDANSKRPRKSKGLETCNWTTAMDGVLIDAYLHQLTMGNKNGNSMTSSAMDNILEELKNHFPDKPISKEKIKDHMKNIKAKWTPCYDLFQNGLSGFGWDSTTNMWTAEDDVWDRLIEKKPEAAEWRHKPIPFYYKLAKLFGKDRATGDHEDTGFEMRARKAANSRSHGATIEEIDHLVETNEVILERFDVDDEIYHSNISPKRPSISTSQDVSSSRTKKRAKKVVEDDTSMREISKTLKTMVEVFKMSSEELVKQSKSANGGDIWAELVEIGVDPASLPKVYMYLVKNADALKAFNGIPIDNRKEMLHLIVPDYPFY